MIYLSEKEKKIVMDILKKYPYTFYAYGSRTKGTHRPTSDLDICFIDHIPFSVQAHIEEDFEESNLPFRVEVTDFNLMSQEFQNIIKNDLIVLRDKQNK